MVWIKTPQVHEKAYHVYHQYTIRVLNKRDEVQKKLKEKGIQTQEILIQIEERNKGIQWV